MSAPRSTLPLAALAALGIAVTEAPSAEGAGLPFTAQTETLDNGLQVVLVPWPSKGLISYNTMVRVGSRDEVEKGVTGFAHFFEHMMFRGTKQHPPEKIDAFLKKTGADQNGFTTDDFTFYTFFGRNDWLEELVAMEADRFQNLEYTEDVFKTESKAVLGEYNKSASSPDLLVEETLRARSFQSHTYGHTTLGYLRDIEDMPNQYAYSKEFFRRFYTPDNAILVAVGDFDPGQLLTLVKKHYGAWRLKRAATATKLDGPQKAEARAALDWKTPTLPILSMSWRTPATRWDQPDSAVYAMLHELLFGKISALYGELVLEKQLVESFEEGSWAHRDPFMAQVVIRVKDAGRLAEVEARVDKAVAALAAGKLDPKVLEDVKSNVRTGLLLSLDTPDRVAIALAFAIAPTGELDAAEKMLAAIERVSVKDVQRFAKRHLTKKNRVVVTLATKEASK